MVYRSAFFYSNTRGSGRLQRAVQGGTKTTFKRPFSDAICKGVTWTPLHIASEKVPLNYCLFFCFTAQAAWQRKAIHLEACQTKVIKFYKLPNRGQGQCLRLAPPEPFKFHKLSTAFLNDP